MRCLMMHEVCVSGVGGMKQSLARIHSYTWYVLQYKTRRIRQPNAARKMLGGQTSREGATSTFFDLERRPFFYFFVLVRIYEYRESIDQFRVARI